MVNEDKSFVDELEELEAEGVEVSKTLPPPITKSKENPDYIAWLNSLSPELRKKVIANEKTSQKLDVLPI